MAVDLAKDLSIIYNFAPAFTETGLLGSEDYLYYVPWMQATYIMAAHKDAMKYLPAGADVNALTWQQLGAWCKAIFDGEGQNAVQSANWCSTASWKATCGLHSRAAWSITSRARRPRKYSPGCVDCGPTAPPNPSTTAIAGTAVV
ncbi:hypothetical protein [Candidatus Amarobacter glycogenicus]|uniref:hypothetical protein n=1 Tax=Candidatus Amarobacter glycogenicus TaxID=3140699 RepID=UPI002A160468|nr:hypothetical protein [Dehalococcoidia bacterium]